MIATIEFYKNNEFKTMTLTSSVDIKYKFGEITSEPQRCVFMLRQYNVQFLPWDSNELYMLYKELNPKDSISDIKVYVSDTKQKVFELDSLTYCTLHDTIGKLDLAENEHEYSLILV